MALRCPISLERGRAGGIKAINKNARYTGFWPGEPGVICGRVKRRWSADIFYSVVCLPRARNVFPTDRKESLTCVDDINKGIAYIWR